MVADDDLAQFGLGGQIALGFTDPVATGLDLATGGLGYAAKAGRLANAVRSGLQAAGTSALMSAATSTYDPEQTLADGVQSAALSFAFGGALGARRGALFDGEVGRGESRASRNMQAPETDGEYVSSEGVDVGIGESGGPCGMSTG